MTRLLPAAVLLLFVGLPAPAQDVDELEKQIDQAIVRGVEWLKKQQKSDGAFTESSGPTYVKGSNPHPNKAGNTALALLALLKSDVEPTDPVIQKGFGFLTGFYAKPDSQRSTYETGVTLMALEALYEARVVAKMKKDGKKVTERAGDFKEPKYTLSQQDLKFASDLVKELADSQSKRGGWRYGNKGVGGNAGEEDISATQIVLLGLKSATRMRVVVPPAAFQKALPYVLDSQEKDGPKVERPRDVNPKPGDRGTYVSADKDRARGWAYMTRSDNANETRVTGSMTCAGVTSLLIIKSVIGKSLSGTQNDKAEQAIYDGFAWIFTHWSVRQNPGSMRSHLYYLYGIERIGALGCFERIGNHVWFREGAEVLVQTQQGDGRWMDEEVEPRELYATCFALLFLKRGTVPIGDVMTGR